MCVYLRGNSSPSILLSSALNLTQILMVVYFSNDSGRASSLAYHLWIPGRRLEQLKCFLWLFRNLTFQIHEYIYIYIYWEQTFINASFIKEDGTLIIDYLLPGIL